ncbi:hypothetical protein ACHAPT_012489 [Fusarium lateritium]
MHHLRCLNIFTILSPPLKEQEHNLHVSAGDMEQALICNNLQCRREVKETALVTTCSHLFCMECAERLGITEEAERRNTCPACQSQFNHNDDAVVANLNPGEEYKMTILSGLSPQVIMECASRALSFWVYQNTQSTYYQQHSYKVMADKLSALGIQYDKIMSDANTEIQGLEHKLSEMTAEQETLRRKNDEIIQALKEKSNKVLQLQELYDKVKRQAELSQIQKAASDAVDLTVEATSQLNRSLEGDSPTHGLSESDNAPAFGQCRAHVSGMNTGLPRSYSNIPREGTLWPRVGGASLTKLERHLGAFLAELWEGHR